MTTGCRGFGRFWPQFQVPLFFARFDGITGSVGKILIPANVYVSMTSTSENNMESLIKKLQSLQNKTTANGCTEQEALHAAEKVAELLDKYGLSIEQLKLDTAKDECSAGAFDLGSKRQNSPSRYVHVCHR